MIRINRSRLKRIMLAALVLLASLEFILRAILPGDWGDFLAIVASLAGGVAYVRLDDLAVTDERKMWLARARGAAFGCSTALFIPSLISFWSTPHIGWLLLVPPFALAGAWVPSADLDRSSPIVRKIARWLMHSR